MAGDERDARARLRAALDAMLADLARARDALDDLALQPAPPSPRNLAEGYRYLLGQLATALDRALFEDPERPWLRQAIHAPAKATIDNPDAIYFAAPIDGARSYRVRGRAQDTRHWRGGAPTPSGPTAAQYLIFECASGPRGSWRHAGPTPRSRRSASGRRSGRGGVPFDGIRDALPSGVRSVLPAERRAQIRIRQRHVQRRHRAF